MELRFSRCSVALLLLLLFVAANAVRGPEVPVDEPRLPAPRSRGSSRFNTQTAKTIETTLDPISIRKPSNRRGVSNQKANGFPTSSIVPERTLKSTKVESNSRNRKFDPKKSIDKNRSTSSSIDLISTTPKAIFNKKGGRQSTGSRQEAPEAAKFQKVSRQSSRSVPSDQVKKAFLDKNGPSVFSAPGNSNETRSRTGRKIQTAFTQRELRSEISASKRFASRRSDDHIDDLKSEIKSDSRTKNATRKTHDLTKRDPLPAESENINVPAILEVTRRSAPSTPSTISEETDFRKSDRGSRSRGKTSFAENIRTDESNKSNSRRGSSRSSEQLGTEQTDFNRRNEYRFSKDEVDTIKLRSSEIKSRISDADSRSRGRFTSQDAQANSRDSKTPSTTSAVLERRNGGRDSRSRTQEVDSRKRSRTRPRVEQTTLSQDIVTVFPEITASSGRSDSDSGLTANVQTASSKSATTGAPSNRVLSTTTSSRASRRESEGTTRSRTRTGTSRRTASKEDFYNHGLGFRGRRPLPDPSTVSTVGTITTTEVPQRVTTNPQESQARGNPGWSLHRRPYTGAESSLVTLEEEIATTSASVSKPPGRRGNKTFVKTPGESLASVKQENLDNENYPPDFKAKLAQLKNSGSASAAKPTPNSPLQGNKKATTSLFSARSRMKLENARKLVKPELLDEETDSINERKHLDIDEEKKLENKLSDLHTESTLGQESVVKPKLARPKKNHETSKVRNFIPKSRNSTVKEEKKTIESSSERIRKNENSSKTRSSFNIRSKSKIENRVESNNSLGRGKSFSRRNKTSEYSSTTQKPKSTLIRHLSKNTNENKSKLLPSRKPLLSRYRNASTAKSGSKVSFHRGTTPSNQIKSTDFNTIGETTENPVTIKNYISVTKSVSTTISEEISTKKLRTKLFNDLSRSSVDETRLLKTKNLKDEQTTAKNFRPTSRYSRKKVQAFKINSAANVSVATSGDEKMNSSQKIDPRSRTATYRRHSEVPLSLLRSSTVEPNSIEITPKATRFKVSSSPSPQLVTQEPAVNVKVSNDSTSVQQQSLQILQDGNAFTGNSGNIFSPTKNILVTAGNVSLLDQIRSTVAPLLGSLGARSPIFSGIYNNATNINTAVRITPNGSPPRFSARYKGAELFVRNPSISQSAVPKITSSTTPFTPIENSGSSPPIEVSSNGEPKVVTFYQALESASITDEQLKTNLQQLGRVAQVDRLNDNDPNGTNSSNNDIEPITVAVTTAKPNSITPSDEIPPTPEATPTSETPTTNLKTPSTFETISSSELNPPLADVSTFLDVNNRIQAATTTIRMTSAEAEEVTNFSNIPNFSNNDIEDLEFSPNLATSTNNPISEVQITTISTSQEISTATEASSTTDTNVFIVTPVKPELSADTGFETTTASISNSSFESTTDSASEDIKNSESQFTSNSESLSDSGLETISNSTPQSPTESPFSKFLSLNDEALYATSSSKAIPGEETFQKLTNYEEKNDFLGSASTINPARNSAIDNGYFSTEIPIFNDGILSTTDSVIGIDVRGNFFENYASTEVPLTITETSSGEIATTTGMPLAEKSFTEISSSTIGVPFTTELSSTTTVQSTTASSTTEYSTTTRTSTTEIPFTTTTSTELPTTSRPLMTSSTTVRTLSTPSSTELTTTSLSSRPLMTSSTTARTLSTPTIIPSTFIPMGGFPRFPKLQSFLDTLAQLGNPTIKSQVMENIETTTMIEPNLLNELTTPLGILTTNSAIPARIKETAYDPRSDVTSAPASLIDQTTFKSAITESKNLLNVDESLNENISPAGQTFLDFSSSLANQVKLNIGKDEFMNMTQSWINDGDSDIPFDNELLSRLMNVATKLSSKSPNDTKPVLMSKTPQSRANVDKMPSLLGGFLDNTDRNQTTERTTAVDIDTTLAPISDTLSRLIKQTPRTDNPETTSINYPSLILDSQTNDAPQTFAPVVPNEQSIESRSTKSPQLQTSSTLDLYVMLSDLVTKAPTASSALDMGTQEITLTPTSTELIQMVEETTPNTPLETTIGSLITTLDSFSNPETVIPNMLTRFQDSSPATAQTTARPNLITSNLLDFPYLSRNPTTLSTRLLPTSFNYNLPTTTPSTRLLPTSFGTTTSSLNNFETTYLPIETTSSPLNNIGTTLSPSSNVGTTLPPTNSNGGNFPTSTSSPSTTATLSSSKLLSIDATPVSNPGAASGPAMITPYAGRFGGLRITPAPRFSSSSSTTAPLRDYLIYGIYPNKTIVRKRPEDNLIDARNVDSPYVIFGIYPDGRLVRKFPNGTVINAPNATSSVPSATSSSSSNSNVVVGSNGSQQGGRIIQDRERDEATRTREAGGQRNSMYIGQDKFINYWINNQPNSNPQVLNVKINSVSTASSQGAGNSPGKLPSFHLSPNSGSGIITVAPNFAWKDPLDQIFGITTNSPPISASVASNILDDANAQNAQIFAPKSSGISSTSSTISSTSPPSTTMPTNPTTALANDPLITTTTANLKLVNTLDGSGVKENPFGTTYDDLAFLNTLLNTQRFGRTTPKTLTEVEKLLADKILSLALGKAGPTRSPKAIQPSNASPNLLIETDPDPEYGPVVIDLYPSSTTEKSNPATWKPITSTSPVIVNPWKTLLNGIAANQIHISTPNSIVGVSSSLRSLYEQQTTAASIPKTTTSTPRTTTTTTTTTPRTTTTTTTPRTTTTTTTTQRTTTTTTTTTEKPTTPRLTTTTGTTTTTGKITIIPRLTFTTIPISTTTIKSPTRQLEITTKPFRPRTTTAAPRWGFGSNLLRVLFGGNIFGTPTTPAPMRNKKPVRPLTTAIPVTSTQRFEPTSKNMASNSQVLLSTQDAIQVTPHVRVTKEQPSVNLKAVSSSAVGVNEGNLKLTQSSTFSPEEDAKFLMSLLNVAQSMGSSTLSPMGEVSKDDEAFLRAILNGQASVQPSSKGENVKSDAALLAALLKDEGIGPYSPPNQLREQLFSAGLEKHRDAQISTTTAPTTTITMKTTTRSRPAAPTWKPSSTYPPPLFGGFNFAGSSDSFRGDSTSNDNVRSQVVNAAIGVTRAFSQFLGGAIMGAAKQLQSFVGNGTRPFFS
ncbi:serine-rich adhesin for platelets-like isoform X2 [Leptopilina heterotoma]|uniref:serine-rich adhesin for platelets-like isoform X2 n=1 Tax=Leptopilina heterotoma TaxID=63436 RepID=UPI001CA7DD0E|nr:serine-rich adhesin for platelets-like isoform X2 [Leptopilina heterotoma]